MTKLLSIILFSAIACAQEANPTPDPLTVLRADVAARESQLAGMKAQQVTLRAELNRARVDLSQQEAAARAKIAGTPFASVKQQEAARINAMRSAYQSGLTFYQAREVTVNARAYELRRLRERLTDMERADARRLRGVGL